VFPRVPTPLQLAAIACALQNPFGTAYFMWLPENPENPCDLCVKRKNKKTFFSKRTNKNKNML